MEDMFSSGTIGDFVSRGRHASGNALGEWMAYVERSSKKMSFVITTDAAVSSESRSYCSSD